MDAEDEDFLCGFSSCSSGSGLAVDISGQRRGWCLEYKASCTVVLGLQAAVPSLFLAVPGQTFKED